MQVIKKGFSIKNEVLDITSIKPSSSGKMDNGQEYPASVKFRSMNIIEDNFEGTFKESEEIIEYTIPCDSTQQTVLLTDLLRKLRASNSPVYINTAIPKLYEGQKIYSAKSLDSADVFILNNGGLKKVETAK